MAPLAPPFFVIAGPTAVGKSALAVAVAERCNGEIVGADAFQVYRGLDILTAKPSAELLARVPHHLTGDIPLSQAFDVAQYLRAAHGRIAEIHGRRHLPVVSGGTGLYLRALLHGLADLPPSDPFLREEWAQTPLAELQRQLTELDPISAAQIDLKNPRRVIRALEVCRLTGRPFSSFREQWTKSPTRLSGVQLTLEREAHKARINRRTEDMFAAGVVDEVRHARDAGPTAIQTLGLTEIRALLAGKLSYEECISGIQRSTRRYAKRQMTWFRRESSLRPVDLTEIRDFDEVADTLALEAER